MDDRNEIKNKIKVLREKRAEIEHELKKYELMERDIEENAFERLVESYIGRCFVMKKSIAHLRFNTLEKYSDVNRYFYIIEKDIRDNRYMKCLVVEEDRVYIESLDLFAPKVLRKMMKERELQDYKIHDCKEIPVKVFMKKYNNISEKLKLCAPVDV